MDEDSLHTQSVTGDDRTVLLRVANGKSSAARLHFEDFRLPEGAVLFISGLDGADSVIAQHGPYRSSGPLQSGEFWTRAVPGSSVVIELQFEGDLASLPFRVTEMALEDRIEEGEPEAETGSGEIRTSVFRGALVRHSVVDGFAIWEGDIILGRAEELEPANGDPKQAERQAGAVSSSAYRWPGGLMPYTIDPAMGNQARITSAIQHWNTNLAGYVRLVPRTSETYYVHFKLAPAGTCSSYLGMIRMAAQPINIGDYCSTGNVIHEIGHALGLYHEHTRSDRDNHVRILTQNLNPNAAYNFQLQASLNPGAYDYGSIMHYGAYAFSINGQPTIETRPAGIAIGQRSGLSAGDINGVKAIYPATVAPPPTGGSTVSITLSSNPSGRTLTADNANITAPGTLQWTPGSTHSISAPNVTSTDGLTRYLFNRWSDGGAQTHSLTTPASATTYAATYNVQYKLSAIAGTGGTLRVSPTSADRFYPANSTVTLMATPAANYCFVSWTGVLQASSPAIAVALTRPATITANFQPGSVTVPASVTAPLAGGPISIAINATSGCLWRAYSYASWITITSASSGTGSATLQLSIAAGTPGVRRTGYVSVGGRMIVVTQP